MSLTTSIATYSIGHDSDTGEVTLAPSLKKYPGKYGYKWTITDKTGTQYALGGITETLNARFSNYVSHFNTKPSYRLTPLVKDPENSTIVEIFGPFSEDVNLAALEIKLIASIVLPTICLNGTKGGNGGGAWPKDLTPSVTTFVPTDTPEKVYPLKRRSDGVISPTFSPGAKKIKGAVFAIQRKKTGEIVYLGQSSKFTTQVACLASQASHASPSKGSVPKIIEALGRSPLSYRVGALPSTIGQSPKSLRASLNSHLSNNRPIYNSRSKASGPAPMKKSPLTAKKLFE